MSMNTDTTIDAVRLALGLQEARARVASLNIANAGVPDAKAVRLDFSSAQGLLANVAAGVDPGGLSESIGTIGAAPLLATGNDIALDEQVADLSGASASYQALAEALNRQFGLMRLALTGRS